MTIFVLPQIFEVGWLQMLGIILMVGGLGWGAAEFLGRRTPRQASDENMAAAQQSRPIITE